MARALLCLLLLPAGFQDPAPIVFRNVTAEAGLARPLAGMLGRTAAWADFDGDGRVDFLVGTTSALAAERYGPAGPVPTRLFRSSADGRFELVPKFEFHANTAGAAFADFDNDGDADLYITNTARADPIALPEPQNSAQSRRSMFLRNDGGKWTDVSDASGACPEKFPATAAYAFDYEANGLLDLFVVHAGGVRLYVNKGDFRFEAAASAVTGIPDNLDALGLAVADLNGDLLPDFFAARSNRLFLSSEGARYREAPRLNAEATSGAAFGDVNRDGLLDLVVGSSRSSGLVRLWINAGLRDGWPEWRDAGVEAGLDTHIPTRAAHVDLLDFDNDGWLDLFVAAGWLEGNAPVPLIFRNLARGDGSVRFETERALPPRAPRDRTRPRPFSYFSPAPACDYDGDGRLDVLLVSPFNGRTSALLHNESPKRRWLDVRVSGRTFNRAGIGSTVRVTKDRALVGVASIDAARIGVAHFGLGDAATVDVEVVLPTGKKVARTGVAADQRITIEEP